MRSSIASIIMFVVMVICITFSINYLKNKTHMLEYSNNKIETAIKSNSFENASRSLNEFKTIWDNYSRNISIFTNHNELDDIDEQIEKLTQYIKYENKEESLISTNIIRSILNRIPEMEKVDVQNLF
ncbi:MAG: DUF4363 family protein [Clostridium sp.]|uniref:DUF4363 family protein n=1 Tax=Clostridium sp. TaxID=1506 RepID=UPI0025C4E32B|nr:DUF4363 family protein [Clostridium sp.]MCH3965243.1 DUF4363 family protein [Clostridium sp.]MCI1714463.1 DUF4363 family protein [Clostridium sp.]MCI1798725.1 DUF4363 family protein [Clostridium sp.]MCI1812544.1 DUF4363 family protein [Clostridium sp.]MCI1869535.1 DUF4363 family protein [Clostridium sp.]